MHSLHGIVTPQADIDEHVKNTVEKKILKPTHPLATQGKQSCRMLPEQSLRRGSPPRTMAPGLRLGDDTMEIVTKTWAKSKVKQNSANLRGQTVAETQIGKASRKYQQHAN